MNGRSTTVSFETYPLYLLVKHTTVVNELEFDTHLASSFSVVEFTKRCTEFMNHLFAV